MDSCVILGDCKCFNADCEKVMGNLPDIYNKQDAETLYNQTPVSIYNLFKSLLKHVAYEEDFYFCSPL